MVSKDILLMGGVGERLSMTSSEDENLQAQTMVLQHSTTATHQKWNLKQTRVSLGGSDIR
jgi:hypothetical protein